MKIILLSLVIVSSLSIGAPATLDVRARTACRLVSITQLDFRAQRAISDFVSNNILHRVQKALAAPTASGVRTWDTDAEQRSDDKNSLSLALETFLGLAEQRIELLADFKSNQFDPIQRQAILDLLEDEFSIATFREAAQDLRAALDQTQTESYFETLRSFKVNLLSYAQKGFKRMHPEAQKRAIEELKILSKNPRKGERKTSFPNKLLFIGFFSGSTEYRCAYAIIDGGISVVAIGPHERFYEQSYLRSITN